MYDSVIQSELGYLGASDPAKGIWNAVPASLIRVTGGHGKWKDPLTGETMGDDGTDVRKGAVVASALSMFNDHRNWWFESSTGHHVDSSTVADRWRQEFGNVDFATAYRKQPGRFKTFLPNSTAGDPFIPNIGGGLVWNTAPAPAAPPSIPSLPGLPKAPGIPTEAITAPAPVPVTGPIFGPVTGGPATPATMPMPVPFGPDVMPSVPSAPMPYAPSADATSWMSTATAVQAPASSQAPVMATGQEVLPTATGPVYDETTGEMIPQPPAAQASMSPLVLAGIAAAVIFLFKKPRGRR